MAGTQTVEPLAGTPRERLLAAADELFYAEGVHTVGIDRVIERAGVAKASLYSTYGSKDALVRAYLESRHERIRARLEQALGRATTPRDRLLAVFETLADRITAPDYRGCAFVRASAESDGDDVAMQTSREFRGWLVDLLVGLARDAGASDPDTLARQLVMVYDGAGLGVRMDRNGESGRQAVAAARALVDVGLAPAG
ncbi:TetR/AcrR family transcriptional regulator [Cellulomonas alba]|uniref:TetR/AcrR family transcriptional regulator n=1 Tax=Cellulomonas alba TaxID=3053467 RepID=A0ABT7SIF1_9CELL|nr:TetR/AcrR family transcriptional regulator [Cellulomonas alba]MDM7855950.1 TetR/AcrR family transcriptional regulator [Cellulomonas alba]